MIIDTSTRLCDKNCTKVAFVSKNIEIFDTEYIHLKKYNCKKQLKQQKRNIEDVMAIDTTSNYILYAVVKSDIFDNVDADVIKNIISKINTFCLYNNITEIAISKSAFNRYCNDQYNYLYTLFTEIFDNNVIIYICI